MPVDYPGNAGRLPGNSIKLSQIYRVHDTTIRVVVCVFYIQFAVATLTS